MSEAFAAAEPLLAEHAQIEAQLADPAVHADAANARKLGRRYAELGRVAQAYTAWKAASDDAEAAAELAEVDESFAAELPSLQQAADAAVRAAARGPHPARPRRRPRRDPRGQGGGGRRGVGAVRRGPAADVHAVRGEDGLGHAAAGRDGVGSRRLQGRAARHQGARCGRPGGRCLGAPEVRGRRPPRPAGARHGVAGPHPHVGCRCPGVPRGRGRGRGGDRPERPAHRRLPVVRPGRPVGQHDRLRRPHHAPAHGHRRVHAEREVAAAEPRGRHARAARPHPGRPPGGGRRRRERGPTLAGPHGRPLRAHPDVQLPGEPHRRPPHRLQGLQPRRGPRR